MQAETLISELISLTKDNLNRIQKFIELDKSTLNYKQNAESWSILECIAHLNRYGDFYLPEIDQQIKNSKHPNTAAFKSGWLGNYFANSMPGLPA